MLLLRYNLDFQRTLEYVKNNLEKTNALSDAILKYIHFESGTFYTLIKDATKSPLIHEFFKGDIVGGIREDMRAMIYNKISQTSQYTCIMDDVNSTFKEKMFDTFNFCGLSYGQEVYYLLSKDNINPELVFDCFYLSNGTWHSLMVIFDYPLITPADKKIRDIDLKNMCIHTKEIFIMAYDGEGYVIWERN